MIDKTFKKNWLEAVLPMSCQGFKSQGVNRGPGDRISNHFHLRFSHSFGLYRNISRSLNGVCAISAGPPAFERRKSSNAHTITFGPHGSDSNDFKKCLHISLGALDHGITFEIKGQKQAV